MNILSIGKSFSQDAHRYIHAIAAADGVNVNTFNLYIGGCPLSLHYSNMLSELPKYALEMNGQNTGFAVSLKDALLNRPWDIITVQQVSQQSPYYETYQPYLNGLIEYVRRLVPKAKIAVHQTWAYEQDSKRLNEELGYANHGDMFADIEKAYKSAFDEIGADYLIPSGKVFNTLFEMGVEKLHRDTYHASLGLGRYALGLTWYKVLTNNNIENNTFSNFAEEIPDELVSIVKKCVTKVVENKD